MMSIHHSSCMHVRGAIKSNYCIPQCTHNSFDLDNIVFEDDPLINTTHLDYFRVVYTIYFNFGSAKSTDILVNEQK